MIAWKAARWAVDERGEAFGSCSQKKENGGETPKLTGRLCIHCCFSFVDTYYSPCQRVHAFHRTLWAAQLNSSQTLLCSPRYMRDLPPRRSRLARRHSETDVTDHDSLWAHEKQINAYSPSGPEMPSALAVPVSLSN